MVAKKIIEGEHTLINIRISKDQLFFIDEQVSKLRELGFDADRSKLVRAILEFRLSNSLQIYREKHAKIAADRKDSQCL